MVNPNPLALAFKRQQEIADARTPEQIAKDKARKEEEEKAKAQTLKEKENERVRDEIARGLLLKDNKTKVAPQSHSNRDLSKRAVFDKGAMYASVAKSLFIFQRPEGYDKDPDWTPDKFYTFFTDEEPLTKRSVKIDDSPPPMPVWMMKKPPRNAPAPYQLVCGA